MESLLEIVVRQYSADFHLTQFFQAKAVTMAVFFFVLSNSNPII
jgi:hypothetical protein